MTRGSDITRGGPPSCWRSTSVDRARSARWSGLPAPARSSVCTVRQDGSLRKTGYAAALAVLVTVAARAQGAVNLELRLDPSSVSIGETIGVGLYAVSPDGVDDVFSGLDVALLWNPAHLELVEAISDGPHVWSFQFGFPSDTQLDGLNDSFLDGNALFQAASFSAATATLDGLLVATLRFVAVGGAPSTIIMMEEMIGQFSKTQVLQPGGKDVTGDLLGVDVTVTSAVPTVSEWGLIVLATLFVTAGVIVIDRPRRGAESLVRKAA